MKVLFVNAPVVRSPSATPESGFRGSGLVFRPWFRGIPGGERAYRALNRSGLFGTVRYGVRAGSRWPWTMDAPHGGPPFPFVMCYAASYLQASGIEVQVLDAVVEEEFDYERFLGRVRAARADVVVVECSTPTIDIDTWVATRIAEFTEVALAGPHLTREATSIAASFPTIRYLLPGEYILSALRMAQTRRPGIYDAEVVSDLDALPFPYREHEGASRYYDPTMPTAVPQLQVWGGKGCPFRCTYCLWPQTMYQGRVSLRDPRRIRAEICECVALTGYRSVFFDDDTFNLGTERVSRLCDELHAVGLPWTMMGRLDCSPDWLYDKMVDNGCVGMRFGVETFDLPTLERIGKGLERSDFRRTLERLGRRHPRLMIRLTMMRDLPGQSAAAHAADLRILSELGYSDHGPLRSYQVAGCAPFPGTRMYDELTAKYGKERLQDWSQYDGSVETVVARLDPVRVQRERRR